MDSKIITAVAIVLIAIGFFVLTQSSEEPEAPVTPEPLVAPEPVTEPITEPPIGENKTCPANVTPEPEPEPVNDCPYECCSTSDCEGIEVCCNSECVECCSDRDCLEGTYCQSNVCVEQKTAQGVASFEAIEADICTDNGRPIVRMFTTTTCPHCKWITPAFDSIVAEYGNEVKFYHWYLE